MNSAFIAITFLVVFVCAFAWYAGNHVKDDKDNNSKHVH